MHQTRRQSRVTWGGGVGGGAVKVFGGTDKVFRKIR